MAISKSPRSRCETSQRLTFVIGSLGGGGAQKVCVSLANALIERGHCVELVVLNLSGAVWQHQVVDQVKLIHLRVAHSRTSVFRLAQFLRKDRPKVILSFNRQISVVLIVLRAILRLEFRIVSRSTIYLSIAERSKNGIWHGVVSKCLTKWIYPRSDLLIAQSQEMKRDLVEYLGVEERRVEVIGNPVGPMTVHDVRRGCSDDAFEHRRRENYVLCVGRLDRQKGLHFAIAAFAAVSKVFPELRLRIVGKGPLENELKGMVNNLDIADKVDFIGFELEMERHYFHAAATLLTSLYEGFPNVLLESIHFGTPVVAFDCPSGPREIVENGVNGYLVRYVDLAHLEETLLRTLSACWSPSQVSRSVERFRAEHVVAAYERVLCV